MKKKILHIQLLPLLSGVQNVMLHILAALDPEEYDIYVASRPDGPLVEEVIKHGYTHIPLPLLKHAISPWDIVVLIQLMFLCRKHRFDIVHTHSSKPGFLGRIAAKIAGVPMVIHTGHGAPFHDGQSLLTQWIYKKLEKTGALFCDKMVFVNHSHRLYYIQHNLIKPAKAITIYNALNPILLKQIESYATHKPHNSDIVTIGSILRFSTQKNIIETIAAAIRVCLARNDVNFIFVGDGEYYNLCNMMVQTHKLGDRIFLPGWQSNPALWLSKFDVFMLYSLYEGLPLSIIEAMYAALPVICSRIPSNAELVDDSNGWLIHLEQPKVLEAELHNIIDAKDSYRQKGESGKSKAMELCSYENFIAAYLEIYNGD